MLRSIAWPPHCVVLVCMYAVCGLRMFFASCKNPGGLASKPLTRHKPS